jgi:hypothetical protein
MNFDKSMIDLVREIRRRAPAADKPGIKLANPELLHEMLEMYQHCSDIITKTLIKELFSMAGDPWPQTLEVPAEPDVRYITKVYRGQTQLIPVQKEEPEAPRKPLRVYRGQVVY